MDIINKPNESSERIDGNLGHLEEETSSKNVKTKLGLGLLKAKFGLGSYKARKVLHDPKKASIIKALLQNQDKLKNVEIIKNKTGGALNLRKQSRAPLICSSTTNKFSSPTTLNFNGVDFLQSQVQTNPALQVLLKEIVTLNNDITDPTEDAINKDIANLRARNNLPSLNVQDDVISDTEECYFCDEHEIESQTTNTSDELDKDSGYSNESHCFESVEEDNASETDRKTVLEPEYIDLEYLSYKKKFTRKKTQIKTSFPCEFCGKFLNAKSTYYVHRKECYRNPKNPHISLTEVVVLDDDDFSDPEDIKEIEKDNSPESPEPFVIVD